jgi:probable HAF family extracellular repeat protein
MALSRGICQLWTGLSIFVFLFCNVSWGQAEISDYDFNPAGEFPDSYYTVPFALSERHIVGYYVNASADNAYVQTGKSFHDAAPSGSITSYLSGINRNGVAVGGYCTAAGGCGPGEGAHAFSYHVKSREIRSFDFPMKGSASTAYGINDKGVIVGGWCQNSNTCPQGLFNPASHGFINDHGHYTTLDFPNAQGTSLRAVNDAGTIVGYYVINNTGPHSFVYQDGAFTTIDFPGADVTAATSINNYGVVAGWFSNSAGSHGFIYSKGKFVQIDRPNSNGTVVTGMDDREELVGSWFPPIGNTQPFKAVLDDEPPDPAGK